MSKEYLLIDENDKEFPYQVKEMSGETSIVDRTLSQEYVDYDGNKVLVDQKESYSQGKVHPYVVVAGIVVSDVYTTQYGKKAVKCDPFPEDKKEDLEAILRKEGFRGNINLTKGD